MELSQSSPPHAGWLPQAGRRLLVRWPAKMFGTTGGMAAFFVAYFWLLRHPLGSITVMPLTALDRLIPFCPAALPLYLSLWVYVSLAPGLVAERRELISYAWAAVALSVAGLTVFLVWPTAVPVAAVDWSLYPNFEVLKSADAAGNACPSLHAAFAVFTAIWMGRVLRQMGAGCFVRTGNVVWGLGILFSTVATRQHVVLDAVAGAALGAAVASLNLWWLRRSRRPREA